MIFIDTTVWVAGIDASDVLHSDGKAVLEGLAGRRLPSAVTTDFVLDETLTILRRRDAKSGDIVEAVSHVLSSPAVRVVYVDEELFGQALRNFRKYQRLSFTDAVTLSVMNRYKITEIYSHDTDFDLKGVIRKEKP